MNISIPCGKSMLTAEVPDRNLLGVYESAINRQEPPASQEAVVLAAMRQPIDSPRLSELAKTARNCVIIASDHTRPVPSRFIIPAMLRELREGNPAMDITILIATGTHRATTRAELVAKFGEDIVAHERIVLHDCRDEAAMTELGTLPSGGKLAINRLAAEADLLVSEGFIEPHFFAGFSGGRKSVLPGIAAHASVLANHCAAFIDSPFARTGKLEGNPIHRDMVWAAERAGLAYIVNVVINGDKRVMRAVAGNPFSAHQRGCEQLRELCQLQVPTADIVITSNGGYPLDQNLYQSVKGMTAAEAAVRKGGVIIMVAALNDGHGGQSFYDAFAQAASPQALYEQIAAVPADETVSEQWEAQIFARILKDCNVIIVAEPSATAMLDGMHLQHAATLDEALRLAFAKMGEDASVAVIPDGVSVIVN